MDITAHYDAEIVAYALGNIKYYKLSDQDLKAVRKRIEDAANKITKEYETRLKIKNILKDDEGEIQEAE
jgi:frataxin-like iron-binding protein CyaY